MYKSSILIDAESAEPDPVNSQPLPALSGIDESGIARLWINVDTWTAADMLIQLSPDGGTTWEDVRNESGTLYRIAGITAGDWMRVPADILELTRAGFRLRFRSVTVGDVTTVNQSADVTIRYVLLSAFSSDIL